MGRRHTLRHHESYVQSFSSPSATERYLLPLLGYDMVMRFGRAEIRTGDEADRIEENFFFFYH